jgi:proton-translocating NADH-quinone oxidoreductase chain N
MELQSFCLYVLAASKRNCSYSTEAGLKYFILGAFASGILLFGSSFLYGFTGITNFEEFGKLFSSLEFLDPRGSVVLLGILFLVIGLLFKMTAAPFHIWSPDVYEGSPTSVTAFFSTAPKLGVLVLLSRLAYVSFYDLFPHWGWVLVFSGIASLGVSCFSALGELKIKRLLAFSSIGHVGLLLLGMACGSSEGAQAVLFYVIIYTIMTLNMFSGVLSLDSRAGQKWQVNPSYFYIHDFHRLASSNPLLSFNFSAILFSMAGVPPLAGFCSKFFIFSVLLNASLYSGALIAVVTSVISSFYYLRLIKIMYFEKREKLWVSYQCLDRENSIILGLSLSFVLVFFLYPTPILFLTQVMVSSGLLC